MIDTTQTNYILADTRQEVLNTPPAPGLLAISKDTSSMFVSDGSRWVETNITHKHNIEHQVTGNQSLEQSPVLHFDTSVTSSMENVRGNTVSNQEACARINSTVSNESMIASPSHQGVYLESDNNGKTAILMNGFSAMLPDLQQAQKRDGAMTIVCVFTPTAGVLGTDDQGQPRGLERQWDPVTQQQADIPDYGDNRYSLPLIEEPQCYFSTWHPNSYGALPAHKLEMRYSNANNIWYTNNEVAVTMTGSQSYHIPSNGYSTHYFPSSELADPVTGGDGNRVHHFNQNYIGRTHIASVRVESNKNSIERGQIVVKLHTFETHALHSDTALEICNGAKQSKSSDLNHGLMIGAPNRGWGTRNFSLHASFHEMLYFDKYLTEKDLNILGTHLSTKWDTGTGDLWRL